MHSMNNSSRMVGGLDVNHSIHWPCCDHSKAREAVAEDHENDAMSN